MKPYQIILILILILVPFFAYGLENQYEGFDASEDAANIFEYFVKVAISAGAIIAVLVIIYNGVNIIIAQGETAKIIIAKERIIAVFVGLLVLLGVYIIASTINPDLVIIKIEKLQEFADNIIGGNNNKNINQLEFEEIPLGAITESILAANSSKRIEEAKDVTEELCYAYDENGDTIDRDGDGHITPEGDTLRGVDMFYCMDELNQAIIKKVKALNAGYLCKNELIDGPMREILKLIQSKDENGNYNCTYNRCAEFPFLNRSAYPLLADNESPYACQTILGKCEYCETDIDGNTVCEEIEVSKCDDHCSCCGRAYYDPDSGCQNEENDHDPCVKEVRDNIDCARNEIKIRIDGESLDSVPPGAKKDLCYFTALWEDSEEYREKFLTLKLAVERMESFEKYYNNRLTDLNSAVGKMKQYGEKLSMAEFQNLKSENVQGKEIVAVPFSSTNNNYIYDPVKYCNEFNCTNEEEVCVSGARDDLTESLYAKEFEFDENYNIPDFKDRRICKVNETKNKEEYSYSGDGTTFYYKKGFEYEKAYENESLRMITDEGEKGYMVSEIPLGEMINDTKKFVNKLFEFTGMIKEEIENVKTKAMEFVELANQCDCSRTKDNKPISSIKNEDDGTETISTNCTGNCNKPLFGLPWEDCAGQCRNEICINDCTNCITEKEKQCICCEECEKIELPDDSFYLLNYFQISTNWFSFFRDYNYLNRDSYINDGLQIVGPIYSTDYDYLPAHRWVGTFGREFEIRIQDPSDPYDGIYNAYGGVYSPTCADDEIFYIPKPITYDSNDFTFCSLYEDPQDSCFCAYYPQNRFYATPEDGDCYGLASLAGLTAPELRKGFFKDSYLYNKIVNMEDGMQILERYFIEAPTVSNYYDDNVGIDCKFNPNKAIHIYDHKKGHLINYGETLISFYPLKTIPVTICEGEEANNFTDKDKEIIELANPWKKIKWIEGENAIDLGVTQLSYNTLRADLPCSNNGGIIIPEQYIARCSVGDLIYYDPSLPDYNPITDTVEYQSILYLTKKGVSQSADYCPSERGKEINKEYYICPYNDLKDKQCRIFNYKSSMEKYNYPEDLKTDVQCTDASTCQSSTDVGHLQKIDLLAKRIENYGKGENLKPEDPNRWSTLDILNLSREKLDKCITGYGLPLKQGAKSYTLLSCEEGIDALLTGSTTILPSFPYPSSLGMWNCQPYNSDYLTPDQKTVCLNNKQHPICTNAIINLLDDYYCLQKEE